KINHHDGDDPHIWTDPVLVKIQAKNKTEALSQKFPKNSELYARNLEKFSNILDELDADIKSRLSGLKSNKFAVYHPSWGYFAARYGLEQIPIETEGKEPKPADLKRLIKQIKDENIKVVFVSPWASKKSAKAIADQTNSEVVEVDHLCEDWLKQSEEIVKIFEKYFK
ncbi:MAG: zinc ABC transporter solute-binding protein, partial [Campylobacter sp.]|nr:zinc ABC transporter solute-binding protein [Campylobacter sp.]